MRSPEPSSPSTAEALLHGQFASWGSHSSSSSSSSSSSNNSCPNSPGPGLSPAASPTPSLASNYALTLTHTHIHIQRLSPRPGKEARLMLPLAELVGCSCPRAPAPPLLVLYWYPPGKRRKGVSRRRQVRAFLAESRAEAERWAAAVQCLLRDVIVTSDTEFSRRLLPRPRRLLLLVNPFSGRGQAMQWCQTQILPMIKEANISYNLIQTERQNHARELIREISLPEWDGIVIVSGDGLLHEVINGLMERPDWEQAIKIPVGILPCGSGNALAGSINHNAGYDMCLRESLLLNCCFLLCRGGVRPMDVVSVTTSPPPSSNNHTAPPRRLFSFLSVAWGFVSDVDIESERYRGLGSARFTLGTLVRIASLRSYKGRLSFLPPTSCTSSPDATPPPPRRTISRSITEGLEGLCHTPIHRTCSDMGISEQRSLRRGEGEREREERQRERERRRERARGGGTGVVRASSLAEDREKEVEMEMEAEEERSGTSSESNEREDGSLGGAERLAVIRDEWENKGNGEGHHKARSKGGEGRVPPEEEEGAHSPLQLRRSREADTGKEAEEEAESPYGGSLQDVRRALRKNSAPSSQISSALFGQPLSQVSSPDSSNASYAVEDMDLNGSYYQKEPYQLDVARERALTISSPFRHSPFSYKPKSLDQNQNTRPRPLSLLQHSHSNSLPPKLSSLSLSLSPTPPSSPSCASPHSSSYLLPRPNTPGSTSPSPSVRSSSSFNFDIAEPAGPQRHRQFCLPLNGGLGPHLLLWTERRPHGAFRLSSLLVGVRVGSWSHLINVSGTLGNIYSLSCTKIRMMDKLGSYRMDRAAEVQVAAPVVGYVKEFTRHSSDVLLNLNELRHRSILTDTTLIVDSVQLRAHCAVLVACSGFFYSLYSHRMLLQGRGCGSEEHLSTVSLPDTLDPSSISLLLDFMYTSRLPLTPSVVPGVLSAATYLQMDHVADTCREFMQLHCREKMSVRLPPLELDSAVHPAPVDPKRVDPPYTQRLLAGAIATRLPEDVGGSLKPGVFPTCGSGSKRPKEGPEMCSPSPESPARSNCQPNSPSESNTCNKNLVTNTKASLDPKACNWKKYKYIVLNPLCAATSVKEEDAEEPPGRTSPTAEGKRSDPPTEEWSGEVPGQIIRQGQASCYEGSGRAPPLGPPPSVDHPALPAPSKGGRETKHQAAIKHEKYYVPYCYSESPPGAKSVCAGDKPYRCNVCGAQFNRPANLKTHSRIHSGEKPYRCDTCGARFVQVAHLRAHILIHTGEKPYPCHTCGTRFRHLQTLKSHLRIHTGEKPYNCEKCDLHFRHKSQLRLHLRQKHGAVTNTKIRYKVLTEPFQPVLQAY